MIVSDAEVRIALGLAPTITDAQTGRVMLATMMGHAAVKKELGYDPEQKTYASQYYPRAEASALDNIQGVWDVDSARRRAVWEARDDVFRFLQLEHLPVREVTEVRVDPSARYGQQVGDFGSGTVVTAGVDYMVEWDENNLCRSGMLISTFAWPISPGTVRVDYRAGYSPTEFLGQATSTSTNDNGFITNKGVDASPVKAATLLECVRAYHTLKAMSLNTLTGTHVPGPLQSERLGDYTYSMASGEAAALLASMKIDVSPEARMLLEPFRHYGLMLL